MSWGKYYSNSLCNSFLGTWLQRLNLNTIYVQTAIVHFWTASFFRVITWRIIRGIFIWIRVHELCALPPKSDTKWLYGITYKAGSRGGNASHRVDNSSNPYYFSPLDNFQIIIYWMSDISIFDWSWSICSKSCRI